MTHTFRRKVTAKYEIAAGRRERYFEMFKKYAKTEQNVKTITHEINEITESLEREDRILWALKSLRASYEKMLTDPSYTVKEKNRLDFDIRQQLRHFITNARTNGYNAVLDYRFPPKATWNEIHAALLALENEGRAARTSKDDRLVEAGNDKAVLTFADGWAWFLLDRQSCKDEGAAMRHCGNVSSRSPSDRLFSLREPVKKKRGEKEVTLWKPHATFVVDTKTVGEMKGLANEKPAAKLHKYIVSLLESEHVKLINGGGYLPENNFSLEDLPEAEREALISKKPSLSLDMKGYVKEHGLDDFVKAYLKRMDVEGFDGNMAILKTYKNIEELAMAWDNDLWNALKCIENGAEHGYDGSISPNDKTSVLELFAKRHPDNFAKFAAETRKENEGYFAEHADDLEIDLDDLLKEYKEDPLPVLVKMIHRDRLPDLDDHLRDACRNGWNRAAEYAHYEAVRSFVQEYPSKYISLILQDKEHWQNTPVKVAVKVSLLLEVFPEVNLEVNSLLEMFSDYYDKPDASKHIRYESEFDEEVAVEYLENNL